MKIKNVSMITVNFKSGQTLKIKQIKHRILIDSLYKKYQNILRKYIKKEPITASHEN